MNNLREIIENATRDIEGAYFSLPIQISERGAQAKIYRERVYCYELYHQLRGSRGWDNSYTLNGEIDKSGHPFFRHPDLKGIKPDLLIHQPGYMRGNYAAIEVKPTTASAGGLRKDLESLTALNRHASYQKLILLMFGAGSREAILRRLARIAGTSNKIDLRLIEVWWHAHWLEPAQIIKLSE